MQIERVLGLIRWRIEDDGLLHDLHCLTYEYRATTGEWQPLRRGLLRAVLRAGLFTPITGASAVDQSEVQRLIDAAATEPLAHQIVREAWQQRITNPRSAVVLGAAALEVGYFSRTPAGAPRNRQRRGASSVVARLQHLVRCSNARRPTDGVRLAFAASLLRSLDQLLSERNAIVHDGKDAPPGERVDDLLRAVRQALWVVDVLNGQ